jgi:16S rRNA (guanine527-N7)-methyltransferase
MDIIKKYFPDLSAQQYTQFELLQPLYQEWNAKINVISRKDFDNFYERHVIHSLAIAKYFNFETNTKIIDVGCGGGFPGIPLAIFFPNVQFLLVDAIGKKIKVVNEVSLALGLKNVIALHKRADDITQKFNYVVSRAVTDLSNLELMAKRLLANQHGKSTLNNQIVGNGLICLKGGDLENEISQSNLKPMCFNLSTIYEEPFFETKKLLYSSNLKVR